MQFAYSTYTVIFKGSLYGRTEVRSKKQQAVTVYEDGSVETYDGSVVEWIVTLEARCDFTTMAALRDFIKNRVKYRLNAFTFTPDANMDAGAGQGLPITVHYWDDELPEPYEANDVFHIPMKLRAYSSGTGIPS